MISALQNTLAQFETFFTHQSPVKNDTSTAARHHSELELPASAHRVIRRASNIQYGIDESSHQPASSEVRAPELISNPHLDGQANPPNVVQMNRRTQIKRGLGADPLPRAVNYSRLSDHSLGHSMQLNIGSVAPLGRIFAAGNIESLSPFDARGSALHAPYQRGAHSSPLRERKVVGDHSSSFSQANNEAGTGIEPRAPSASGRFNRTLVTVVENWGITYSGDKRTSVDNFLARLEKG